MTKIVSFLGAVATILRVLLHAGAAQATAAPIPQTWVSHSGNDANPCTALSPCLTFAGAYAKTSAGGEIKAMDAGDFGALLIKQAITIDGAGMATVKPATGELAFSVQAASTDAIVLRGLTINGSRGGAGIYFYLGASLLIDHCKIDEFSVSGLEFSPGFNATLWVTDTVLTNDGYSGGESVWIIGYTGVATAHLERVQILGAIGNGIRVDGTAGSQAADVELRDVTVDAANGGSAIVAVTQTSGGPTAKIVADNVTVSHNAGYGFRAVGGTASVYLRHSTIEDNGVGIGASSGGVVYSYGDNSFAGNLSGGGVTPTPIGLK